MSEFYGQQEQQEQQTTRTQHLAREKALFRYTTALDQGDIDTLHALLQQAEGDLALEQMIIETQKVYQAEDDIVVSEDEVEQARELLLASSPTEGAIWYENRYRPPTRFQRFNMMLRVLAAALVICALLASFLVLYAFHNNGSAGLPHSKTWKVINSPSPGSTQNSLNAVAVLSASDVWAVGYSDKGELIEHWNGTQWSVIPGVQSGATYNVLSGIAAVSANDIWAVGSTFISNTVEDTLVEHWDGKTWNIVPSPGPGKTYNSLNAIAVASANDIWAVGLSSDISIDNNNYRETKTLIEHWNGKMWNIVPSPNPRTAENYLNAVAVVSANDVWAVGSSFKSTKATISSSGGLSLIEHWNGAQWSIVPGTSTGAAFENLLSLASLSSSDVWAVGFTYSYENNGDQWHTLVEHWDGKKWSVVPSPSGPPDVDNNYLSGVVALSATDVWAVGYIPSRYPQQGKTLIEHWDGTRWSIVPSPSPGPYNNFLVAAARDPHSNAIWAVGYYGEALTPERTIIEAYAP